ncbi:unnamed protein product [Dibothriocephalus latus]|uniref:XK-related protein n=1 Tax=Dibothriocephalus latus TaxID=60516 RepID=A0A3P7ME30_DIBLA|nr:unnamed protein product [Dibothriocephalus latus]
MSWASSNLWFTIREQMYFPCPCGYFQLSSYLYCLSNLFMLSARLLALSAFAASVGPMPLVYVLLANACIAGLTELYICWDNAERSKPSKANVITRIVECLCLVFDVPFSITFMMDHVRISCYCLWTVETLFLDVFAYFWSRSQQTSTAANKISNRLQSSASLQTALLVVTIVFTAEGIVLRYLHYRKELNNLKILNLNSIFPDIQFKMEEKRLPVAVPQLASVQKRRCGSQNNSLQEGNKYLSHPELPQQPSRPAQTQLRANAISSRRNPLHEPADKMAEVQYPRKLFIINGYSGAYFEKCRRGAKRRKPTGQPEPTRWRATPYTAGVSGEFARLVSEFEIGVARRPEATIHRQLMRPMNSVPVSENLLSFTASTVFVVMPIMFAKPANRFSREGTSLNSPCDGRTSFPW